MEKINPIMLVIIFGGTSTKVAICEGYNMLHKETLSYSFEEIKGFKTVWDQTDLRKSDIKRWVNEKKYGMGEIDVFVCCSGLVKPCEPGIYEIDENMLKDFKSEKYGIHPSNPGCCLCYELGKEYGKPALTVDPANEVNMMKIARYSGLPLIWRPNSYHVLNQKAIAKSVSAKIGKSYETANIIVAHLGSGITVGAHYHGKVIDVNDGIESDGPFSPVRTGALPVGPLVDLCYSGKYTKQEMHKMLGSQGGLIAYLGNSDGKEIEKRINEGDEEAKEVVEAMAYQISKEIGARSVALRGDVDAIVITGGLANWSRITDLITCWIQHIAHVYVYPGEKELESLAAGALRYMKGEEELKKY